ncbi:MAG: winged helix-turn-helix domain-containing protein [Proteobacteria bacterium]|nr:winged helix-turn-helix domain-containing protein [Pseudomonadota bacterium]
MIYRFAGFELDMDRFELRDRGVPVAVEPQVFTLLALLVTNRERMVLKNEIHERIWSGRIVSEAALSSRIRSVRQAIGDDGNAQRLIRTVRGKGFRFVGEVVNPADSSKSQEAAVTQHAHPAISAQDKTRPVIAVLPFANLSDDTEQEYFSDAITTDIVASLSKYRWLDLIARSSTRDYKGKPVDLRQLAHDLGTTYVIEGSVRRAGSRIRVTAQLHDASTGINLWSDRYDRGLEDVFAVQDEITAMIAARLEPEIGLAERQKVLRAGSRDLHAWDCYHLGISHFFRFTSEGNREAQRLLQQSRELDPDFGEAHAWWAYAVVLGMVYWDTEPSDDLLDQALAATRRALELDDRNAVFYALKARVQLARGEYDSAIAENEVAITLNPSFAAAHCGLADSFAYEGRYEEAIEGFQRAIDLSPNDPQRWAFLTYGALALIFKGDYETAIQWADRAHLIPNCQYWTTAHKAVALALLDRRDEARKVVKRLREDKPEFSREFARKKLFYLKRPEQLQRYLDALEKAGVPER